MIVRLGVIRTHRVRDRCKQGAIHLTSHLYEGQASPFGQGLTMSKSHPNPLWVEHQARSGPPHLSLRIDLHSLPVNPTSIAYFMVILTQSNIRAQQCCVIQGARNILSPKGLIAQYMHREGAGGAFRRRRSRCVSQTTSSSTQKLQNPKRLLQDSFVCFQEVTQGGVLGVHFSLDKVVRSWYNIVRWL